MLPFHFLRKPEDDQPANQQYINENQANEERQPLLGDAEDDQVVEIDPQMLLQVADSVHNAAETLSSAVEAMARSSQRGQQMSRSALRHAAEGMAAAARAVSPRPSAPPAMNFIKTCPPSAGRSGKHGPRLILD